jgi:hypothetical protein
MNLEVLFSLLIKNRQDGISEFEAELFELAPQETFFTGLQQIFGSFFCHLQAYWYWLTFKLL